MFDAVIVFERPRSRVGWMNSRWRTVTPHLLLLNACCISWTAPLSCTSSSPSQEPSQAPPTLGEGVTPATALATQTASHHQSRGHKQRLQHSNRVCRGGMCHERLQAGAPTSLCSSLRIEGMEATAEPSDVFDL